MQTHHSNLQQHHQLSLHTSNVSISDASSCQQQHQGNYAQQNQRHQTQDRVPSNPSSYSLAFFIPANKESLENTMKNEEISCTSNFFIIIFVYGVEGTRITDPYVMGLVYDCLNIYGAHCMKHISLELFGHSWSLKANISQSINGSVLRFRYVVHHSKI